jgi:enamine deaminase RidA (YjgF/YER057c/UK114 family)
MKEADMVKTLIRRSDGISGGPEAVGIHAMAIRSRGDFVFLMGQGGYDLDGTFVGRGDPGTQAAQACRNIIRLVKEAGGSADSVCKLTIYMTDVSYRSAVYTAIERTFAGSTFCRTGLVVVSLGPPEYLVEIDAMAVI